MKREKILIILGVLTALTPFYGLPGSYTTALLMLFGLTIAYIGRTLCKKDSTPQIGGVAE
jgi:hypothetical protein